MEERRRREGNEGTMRKKAAERRDVVGMEERIKRKR